MVLLDDIDAGLNGLPRHLSRGDVVYRFLGPTYGCIAPGEVAISLDGSQIYPFHGIPWSAVSS